MAGKTNVQKLKNGGSLWDIYVGSKAFVAGKALETGFCQSPQLQASGRWFVEQGTYMSRCSLRDTVLVWETLQVACDLQQFAGLGQLSVDVRLVWSGAKRFSVRLVKWGETPETVMLRWLVMAGMQTPEGYVEQAVGDLNGYTQLSAGMQAVLRLANEEQRAFQAYQGQANLRGQVQGD